MPVAARAPRSGASSRLGAPRTAVQLGAGLLALGLLAGCGAEPEGPGPGGAGPTSAALRTGPPSWSAARDEVHPGGLLIDVRADGPCRLRVLLRGEEERADATGVRTLAAGETVRLWCEPGEDPPPPGAPVPDADRAAGRTEAQVLSLAYGWSDSVALRRAVVVGARPGRARRLEPVLAAPPGTPRVLPFESELELLAVALADGGPADLSVVGGDRGARVRGLLGPEDRVRIERLVLRVERMGP